MMKDPRGSVLLTVLIVMSILLGYAATIWRAGAYRADTVYELYHQMQQCYACEGAFNRAIAYAQQEKIGKISLDNWPPDMNGYTSSVEITPLDTKSFIVATLYQQNKEVMSITGNLSHEDDQWYVTDWHMLLPS